VATVRSDFGKPPQPIIARKAPRVRHPIRLKALSTHPGSGGGLPLRLDEHDDIASFLGWSVTYFNAFAEGFHVEGCTAPRWYRQFIGHIGQGYGRWHTAGSEGCYQSMPEADRLSRIRINGEPVAEIDISASLLTMLHGLLGKPAPQDDAYSVPGLDRAVAKVWINAVLGSGKTLRRWSDRALKETPALATIDVGEVESRVLSSYPFLAQLPHIEARFCPILSDEVCPEERRQRAKGKPIHLPIHHRLTGIEANVLTSAMMDLKEQGILSLPMHDGLIVPASKLGEACEALWRSGLASGKVSLRLKVSRAGRPIEYRLQREWLT